MTVVDDAITALKAEVATDISDLQASFQQQLAAATAGTISLTDAAAAINAATADLHAKYAPPTPAPATGS